MAVLPDGVILSHINSPAKLTEALRFMCDVEVPQDLLKSTELRLAGNAEARSGNLEAAVKLYSDVCPPLNFCLLCLRNKGGNTSF